MKDIRWYEWKYKININWDVINHKWIIMKTYDNWNWYLYISLYSNWKYKNHYIHRLLAEAYIKNKNECVNHIDWNKHNNSINNLEWTTYSLNQIHSHRVLWNKGSLYWVRGKDNKLSIEINQYSLEWKYIKTRECAEEIRRQIKIDPSCIIKCCKGKRNKAWWYKWEYK